jgi:hypothetical protein
MAVGVRGAISAKSYQQKRLLAVGPAFVEITGVDVQDRAIFTRFCSVSRDFKYVIYFVFNDFKSWQALWNG